MKKAYICYVIKNQGATYCGMTNDDTRRLRQHNSEIKGGARYTTRKKGTWSPLFHVCGFADKSQAMQFEWSMKHRKPPKRFGVSTNTRGVAGRVRQLEYLLSLGRVSKKYVFAHTIRVRCYMDRETYLRHAGLTAVEFDARRAEQDVYFVFHNV